MIEKIKELLSSDLELNIDSERDEKLIQYIKLIIAINAFWLIRSSG